VLEEDEGEALETVKWWLSSTPWDTWSGGPSGPPQYPLPGGELRQYAKMVDAVTLLRTEWRHLGRPSSGRTKANTDETPSKDAPRRRRR